jgi:carboxyl-terminal processing protease
MKKIALYLLFSLCTLVCIQAQNMNTEARKLSMALYAVANLYVDSTNMSKLTEDAIIGMLEKLDPHSNYMDPEETKEMTEPLQGNFDGIGIQFTMLTDTLYVIQVIAGGPSERVGLLAGDRILLVNDTLIAGVQMKSVDIQKRLRGPRGTDVHVKVLRYNEPQLIDFKITRAKIPVHSLEASYMVDKRTGYIKLNRFALSSVNEFQAALTELKSEGMKNLILDLQGNGGGYLNTAIDLADEFLGKGKLIVYTEGHNHPRENAVATDKGGFEDGRLVILVDESSASASEILAGTVQDWDRGLIVGRRTFGKGLVQKPIPLPDGSMIRLTVSRYYTPSGRGIQKPYENGKSEDYNRDLISRYNRGELMSADSIHFPDSLKFSTLQTKRIVYGGGGIMPDLFIPLDTTHYTDYHLRLVAKGLINRVAMNYLDRNRALLTSTYPKFAQYKDSFDVPETLLQELIHMAEQEDIPLDEEAYSLSESLIKLQTKALIARDMYDTGNYYQIINEENQSYKAAFHLMNDTSAYNKSLMP